MTEWIGGRRPVAEALAAGREAHRLIVSASARPAPELRAITDAARRIQLPVDRVPADQMTRIGGFDGHQGVLLEVGERRWATSTRCWRSARRRSRPAHARPRAPAGSDQLRHAATLGRGGRRRRRRLSRARRRAAERRRGQGQRRRQRAPADRADADDRRGDPRAQVRRPAARRRRPGCARHRRGERPDRAAGDRGRQRGERPVGQPRGADATCSSASRWPGRVASLNASTAGALLLFEVVRQRGDASGCRGLAARMVNCAGGGAPPLEVNRCRSTCRASATRPRHGHGW